MKKEAKLTKSFVPNNLLTNQHLADYLITKHSMFLLEIKQRTPHAEKTVVFTTLEPKNKTISFFIQNDSNNHCLHRISCTLCLLFTQCLF